MKVFEALFVIIGVAAVAGDSCPAKDNESVVSDNEPTTESLSEDTPCKDFSNSCSDCADKCNDERYTQWMEMNCPKTCGICHNNVIPQSSVTCLKSGKGYPDANVLETVEITSYNDCKYRCLTNSECIGIHITNYKESPLYCVLAKTSSSGDTAYTSRTDYFAATRACIEQNPSDECDDNWDTCDMWDGFCHSCKDYTVVMMRIVCSKTCRSCGENEYVWTKIAGKKAKGKALMRGLTLEGAEGDCEGMGEMCSGVSCKGNSSCSAMGNVSKKKLKNKTKFDTYTKEYYRGLENLGCWKEIMSENYAAMPTKLLENPEGDLLLACKEATLAKGWSVFGVKYNRACYSSEDAAEGYKQFGSRSTYYDPDYNCDPTDYGSRWNLQVYKIRD